MRTYSKGNEVSLIYKKESTTKATQYNGIMFPFFNSQENLKEEKADRNKNVEKNSMLP